MSPDGRRNLGPGSLRTGGVLSLLLLLAPISPAPAEPAAEDGYALVRELVTSEGKARRRAARRLAESGDRSLLPAMVDALFFVPKLERADVLKALETLSGEKPGRAYHDWVEYLGSRPEIEPKDGYAQVKVELLARIDPNYRKVLYPGAPSRIRLEEVVWGGVRLGGIPSLDRPRHVPAAEARVLRDNEKVFGVYAGGEARAYPIRILSWHEMLNDEVGGEPITLSYCTLCGSGVLFKTRTPSGNAYTFGTSGLLYRSNKLMVDQQTLSLWSNLTGEPVIGRRARGDVRLEMLPLTITTWKGWRTRHPETTAVLPDPDLARRWGFDYRTGAADRARAGVSFPVWQKSDLLPRDEEIYALRIGGRPKAYPLTAVLKEGVVNDELGGERLVVVGDRRSGAVRAYRRGDLTFRDATRDETQAGVADATPVADTVEVGPFLIDEAGRRWRVEEDALVLAEPAVEGATARFERLPGHAAFWFGWFGFFPTTEIYGTEDSEESP